MFEDEHVPWITSPPNEPEIWSRPEGWSVTGEKPEPWIWGTIRAYYVRPLRDLMKRTGVILVPSVGSVWRSEVYEHSKGRSGQSLHTFPVGSAGAADLRALDYRGILHVVDLLVEHCPFRRIAVYPRQNFVHVDYGRDVSAWDGSRQLFQCEGPERPWILMSNLPEQGR